MAQSARTEAEKAANTVKNTTDNVAELGKRTADQAADAAREAVGTTEIAAREGFQAVRRTTGAAIEVERAVARRSAEGTTELGQALIDLVNEQTRHNVELVQALTRTVDWNEVARLQSEFLRVSLERAAQLTQRYLKVTQALITSAADAAARDQAKKAS